MRLISSLLHLFLVGTYRKQGHHSGLSRPIPATFSNIKHPPNQLAMSLDLPVSSPAYSLYKFIHTSIRGQLAQLLIDAGKTDYSDVKQVEELHGSLLKIQSFLKGHAVREDTYIQPVLKTKAFPDLKALNQEHQLSDEALENLVSEISDFKEKHTAMLPMIQDKKGYQFYLNLAAFSACYFNHMNTEEQNIMPFLRTVLTPEEIVAIYMSTVASIPDKEVVETISAIFPYIDFPQQIKITKMLRIECADHFEAIVNEISKCLEPHVCQNLFRHIDLEHKLAATSQAFFEPKDLTEEPTLETENGLTL